MGADGLSNREVWLLKRFVAQAISLLVLKTSLTNPRSSEVKSVTSNQEIKFGQELKKLIITGCWTT